MAINDLLCPERTSLSVERVAVEELLVETYIKATTESCYAH